MANHSEAELGNVQNYLLLKGHACPTILGDEVHYIDQTKGQHRVVKSIKILDLLEEIMLLKKVDIEDYVDKSIFVAGSQRLAVGIYQVMEVNDRLIYCDEFRIERQNKLET